MKLYRITWLILTFFFFSEGFNSEFSAPTLFDWFKWAAWLFCTVAYIVYIVREKRCD